MNIDDDLFDIGLRQLRVAHTIHEQLSISKAAEHLNRTQSALTKSLNKLEEQLGVALFNRTSRGVAPTVYGTVLSKRVALALEELKRAGLIWQQQHPAKPEYRNLSLFSMDIGTKRLLAYTRVCDLKNVNNAAAAVGITRAGINNIIREFESLLETPLFEKSSYGLEPTALARTISTHIKLAFVHLRHGLEDIASTANVTTGDLRIGTLPYTRTLLTPRAINQVLAHHPQLNISTLEGNYTSLETALRSGDIDFIVGALRIYDEKSRLKTETLLQDKLAVIARADHPLQCQPLALKDLESLDWVLPANNTPSRQLFQEIIRGNKLAPPRNFLESSSLATVRGLLMESDRVALLSEHQVYYETKYKMLAPLQVELKDTQRPIGITMRAQEELSPAMNVFLASIREIAVI